MPHNDAEPQGAHAATRGLLPFNLVDLVSLVGLGSLVDL